MSNATAVHCAFECACVKIVFRYAWHGGVLGVRNGAWLGASEWEKACVCGALKHVCPDVL